MSKESYEQLAEAIEAVSDTVKPNLPIAVVLQEAEELAVWCVHDRLLLESAGLDWALVEQLPIRAAACRYLETQWQCELNAQSDLKKQWLQQQELGKQLRLDLIRHFRFAFRDLPDGPDHLKKMGSKVRRADMIQDLCNQAILGRAYQAQLAAISFDLSLLDQAEHLSEELRELHARVQAQDGKRVQVRRVRDRAYTYLRQAIDEIRQYGKFALRAQPNRLRGYASPYSRKNS
jgi:hypothetical protein